MQIARPGLRAVIAALATITTAGPTLGASGCSLPAASQAIDSCSVVLHPAVATWTTAAAALPVVGSSSCVIVMNGQWLAKGMQSSLLGM